MVKQLSTEKAHKNYRSLLEQTHRSIESLIAEIESETVNNLTEKMPREIIFDTVPILNKLRESIRFIEESLYIYRPKANPKKN